MNHSDHLCRETSLPQKPASRAFVRDGVKFSLNGTAEAHAEGLHIEADADGNVWVSGIAMRDLGLQRSSMLGENTGDKPRRYRLSFLQIIAKKRADVLTLLERIEPIAQELITYKQAVRNAAAGVLQQLPVAQSVESDAGGDGNVE